MSTPSMTQWLPAPVVLTTPVANRFYFTPSPRFINGGIAILEAYSDNFTGGSFLQHQTYVAYSVDYFGNLKSVSGFTDGINAQNPQTVPNTTMDYQLRAFGGTTTASLLAAYFDTQNANGTATFFTSVIDISGVTPVVHSGPSITVTPVPKTLTDNIVAEFASLQNSTNNVLFEVEGTPAAGTTTGLFDLIGPAGNLIQSGTGFSFSDSKAHVFHISSWDNANYGQLVEVWNPTTNLADLRLSTINATTGAVILGWTAATELQSMTAIRWQLMDPSGAGMIVLADGSDTTGRGFFEYVVDNTSSSGGTGGTIKKAVATHYTGTVTQDARIWSLGLGNNEYIVNWVDGNGLTVELIDSSLNVLETYNIAEANGTSIVTSLNDGRFYVEWRVQTSASSIVKYTILETNVQGATAVQISNQTTHGQTATAATPYSGPVAGLLYQYIDLSKDNLNVTAVLPNGFIHTGSGFDAIDVSHVNGTNVLDGGTNSNFLVGGTAAGSFDTFFVDNRSPPGDIWSTVVNFHKGDDATVWGVTQAGFNLAFANGEGAAGFTGLTLHVTKSGVPTASLTLAGYTTADLTNGKLSTSFGSVGGSDYFFVHANS